MELLYSFTVALFLTTALIPLCISLAPSLGLMDRPDATRKVHVKTIPRCGGLAMVLGAITPLAWFLPNEYSLIHLLAGALLIAVFGLMDDRNDLNYKWKFLGQILATILVIRGGILIHRLPLLGLEDASLWLTYPLTFFFILGVTNAVNLTDGLDGLAAGTTLLALAIVLALALQTEQRYSAFIALTVIGGVLGFLRYNTFPAQVFMGDVGSQSLGFIAACLSIQVTQSALSATSPALPLLILGLPILDTLTVMSIRIAQGRSPFSPDKNHLHHQIMALGFRHNEAVAIIYVLQIGLLGLAFTLRFAEDYWLLIVYGLFCISLLSLLRGARQIGWRFRTEDPQQEWMDRRNIFLRKLDWFYHHSAHVVQALFAILLLAPLVARSDHGLHALTVILLPLLLASVFLYQRFPAWSTRLSVYPASVLSVYLMVTDPALKEWLPLLNGDFALLALVLVLAIRMTRREHFRLDTQDLLVLVIILAVPLLPISALYQYAVGEITLRLAVLMYSCEFVIGKTSGKALLPLNSIAVMSVFLTITLHEMLSLF